MIHTPSLTPTIVPVPSFGLVYPESFPFYNRSSVYIKQMTALEEDILLGVSNYQDGSLIDKLVASCVVEPAITVEQSKKLLAGDKEAILLALRVTGYGQLLNFKIPCPSCEKETEIEIDLGSTTIQQLGGDYGPEELTQPVPNQNMFEVVLPISKKQVTFKFPTEVKLIMNFSNPEDSFVIPDTLRNIYQQIIAVDGNEDKTHIRNSIGNLKVADSSWLRNYYNSIKPFVDLNYLFACTCGYREHVSLICDNTIFHIQPKDREGVWLEPWFLLGYYYGMSWETYLNYPVYYRRWLIERINKEIKSANEKQQDIPTKAPHDNTEQIRAMASKVKTNMTNARMQRFT
jgi:hypothetical protein